MLLISISTLISIYSIYLNILDAFIQSPDDYHSLLYDYNFTHYT